MKTAILPSGGFYRMYKAECPDSSSAEVASLQRGLRWCSSLQGELNCFRHPEDAVNNACMENRLAATAGEGENSSDS